MRECLSITKALADGNRVRILLVLRRGELCVCQLTELFGLAPSTMSKHLSILYQARLVNTRKDGRLVYYSRAGKEAAPVVRAALEWLDLSVAESEQAAEDAQRLKEVLKMELAGLCRKQCRRQAGGTAGAGRRYVGRPGEGAISCGGRVNGI